MFSGQFSCHSFEINHDLFTFQRTTSFSDPFLCCRKGYHRSKPIEVFLHSIGTLFCRNGMPIDFLKNSCTSDVHKERA